MGMALVAGSKIGYYNGNPATLTEDCQLLRPTIFPSVPRLYTRIYSTIKQKFGALKGCTAWIANKGVQSKTQALLATAATTNSCYDMLVFNKLKALLGGQVEYMVTGSAPIDMEVLNFMKVCFCCPLMEGYGLTESSGATTLTASNDPVAGHVGGPLGCTKLRLKSVPEMNYNITDKPYPRGEVMIKGANVTAGYFKAEKLTADAFDNEGWFCTGDIGRVYPNGSLAIVDRVKNIFKLSHGEYIAPEKLENVFVLAPLVAQVFIHGDSDKNSIVGIVAPEEGPLKHWAKENNKTDDISVLVNDPDVIKAVKDQMMALAIQNKFTGLEKCNEITLTADPFSVENDILTPTFKLKRHVAREVYKNEIAKMY